MNMHDNKKYADNSNILFDKIYYKVHDSYFFKLKCILSEA